MVYVRTEPKTRVERFPKILNRYVTIKKLSIAENRKKNAPLSLIRSLASNSVHPSRVRNK